MEINRSSSIKKPVVLSYQAILILSVLVRFSGELLNSITGYPFFTYITASILVALYSIVFFDSLIKKSTIKTYELVFYLYIVYLLFRISPSNYLSIKGLLSEFIVVSFLIVVFNTSPKIKFLKNYTFIVLLLYKIIVLIGILQLFLFFISNRSLIELIIERPVVSIFAHQNNYAIFVFSFTIYLFFKKKYLWVAICFLTYLGGGNRSLMLYSLALLPIFIPLFFKQKLSKFGIFASLLLLLSIHIGMFIYYKDMIVSDFWAADVGRVGGATYVWRLEAWRTILMDIDGFEWIFGSGIHSSNILLGKYLGRDTYAVHNDFVMLIHDIGVVGISIYFIVIILILIELFKYEAFISLAIFILILGFMYSGNFIFQTSPLFVFILFSIEIFSKKISKQTFIHLAK